MAIDTLKVVFPEGEDELPAPAGNGAGLTRRVNVDAKLTRHVSSVLPNGQWAPLGTLPPGELLLGEYEVERTLYPHESLRPGLYLCHGAQGRVMVKVYAITYPPKPELWNTLAALDHPNVIRTYRTYEETGFFVEVQEYCNGGTLAEMIPHPGAGLPPVPAEWIMTVMAPQVAAGLRYLHQTGIIHRDIKPANIYIKRDGDRETLVLADFDISAVLDQSRTSRDTQRAGGTWLYTAPEAFPRFVDDSASGRHGRVTRSSDYFSLGISIIELLLGTTSLHQCQLPDLFDFYLQGGRVQIPSGIPGRLALLLRGLLIRNRHTRWGADEVERWLAEKTTDGDLKRVQDDEQYEFAHAVRPYRIHGLAAIDLPGLADALFREPEAGTEDLLHGDVLLNWIGNLDSDVARTIRRDREEWRNEPEIALYYAVMRCDSSRPFIFADGAEAYTAPEWLKHAIRQVRQDPSRLEDFSTVDLFCRLESWLRLKSDPEPILADGVHQILTSPTLVRLEELAYLIQPTRPFPIAQGVSAVTPQDFVRYAYGTPADWQKKMPPCYRIAYQRWFEGGLCAWLRQRGLADLAAQCDHVYSTLTEHPYAAFETILRLLDPSLPTITLHIDTFEIPALYSIPHGERRICTLPYKTEGCGVPFGAFDIKKPAPGAQLGEHLLTKRTGKIEVTIDSTMRVPAYGIHRANIQLESGFTRLASEKVGFTYRVVYPTAITMSRMLAGAAIGALVFGIPRALLSALGKHSPVQFSDIHLSDVWYGAVHAHFPEREYLIAFVVLCIGIFWGLRLWFAALRKSEV